MALLEDVGFVDVEIIGWTNFWTSATTRGIDFVARKPATEKS